MPPVKRRSTVVVSPATAALLADVEPASSRRLLTAALEAFARSGFHAATTREIGEGAGMSAAALYVHYEAKGDLLYELAYVGHQHLFDTVDRAVVRASERPDDRVRQFISAFARWHVDNHVLARVIQYELKALPPKQLRRIALIRGRFEKRMAGELEAGVQAGVFDILDIDATALAALSLCIDLARWYSPGPDRMTAEEMGDFYAELVLRMLARREAASSARGD